MDDAAARPKPKLIHTTKLFGGRETAAEVHRKYAWTGGKCLCGDADVVIQIDCYATPKDLIENLRAEPLMRLLSQTENGQLPTFPTKYGPMTLFSKTWACETHRPTVEREAARLPSWVMVEIDRGPGVDKVISQVPAQFRHLDKEGA